MLQAVRRHRRAGNGTRRTKSTPRGRRDWTYDTQLKAAEACPKARLSRSASAAGRRPTRCQTWGAIFGAFGADLVDAKGNITVDSDNVRRCWNTPRS